VAAPHASSAMRRNRVRALAALAGLVAVALIAMPALGVDLHEAGQFRPDETFVGRFTSDDPIGSDRLCALLVG